eukprot:1139331-Pelagomonas_calceolata.AAC.2
MPTLGDILPDSSKPISEHEELLVWSKGLVWHVGDTRVWLREAHKSREVRPGPDRPPPCSLFVLDNAWGCQQQQHMNFFSNFFSNFFDDADCNARRQGGAAGFRKIPGANLSKVFVCVPRLGNTGAASQIKGGLFDVFFLKKCWASVSEFFSPLKCLNLFKFGPRPNTLLKRLIESRSYPQHSSVLALERPPKQPPASSHQVAACALRAYPGVHLQARGCSWRLSGGMFRSGLAGKRLIPIMSSPIKCAWALFLIRTGASCESHCGIAEVLVVLAQARLKRLLFSF